MNQKSKKFVVSREIDKSASKALKDAGIPKVIADLYASRGISSKDEVSFSYDSLVHYSLMKNVENMALQVADAIESKKRILIISDYDCDGATACCVLNTAFSAFNANFDYLVPDRLMHGYGLTPSIVQVAANLDPKPDYIITVDNGVSSFAGVDEAKRLGIKVWVTDHHLPGDKLPDAECIINPNLKDCEFPSKNLAGCGVAYYLAWALFDEMERRGHKATKDLYDLLPFVALGTIADVVQLDYNNRALVHLGMEQIRNGQCSAGIMKLAEVAGRDPYMLSCSDVGFALGPRINAAGRLKHMSSGIECLLCEDSEVAQKLAQELDAINKERRKQQEKILDESVDQITALIANEIESARRTPSTLVAYNSEWHEGVVGIVAGRIKDTFYRPTLILTDAQDGSIKGSGRSIPGLHLKHVLDEINARFPGLITKYGGHAMAAGLSINKGALESFKKVFEEICTKNLKGVPLEPVLEVDKIKSISNLDFDTINDIRFCVWGQGFPEPVFMAEGHVTDIRRMGSEKNHTKVSIDINGEPYEAVRFFDGEWTPVDQNTFVFKPGINEFRGKKSIQLLIEETNFELKEPTRESRQSISRKV